MTAVLRQFLNPFANSTGDPKIPDGGAILSVGQPFNAITHGTFAQTTMAVLITPFIGTPLYVAHDNMVAPLRNNAYTYDWTHPALAGNQIVATGGTFVTSSKWRIVSQALKCLQVNTTQNDNGWWEAVRLQPLMDLSFREDAAQNTILPNVLWNANNPTHVAGVALAAMSDDRTYTTGRMKELNQFLFQLNETEPEHHFNELKLVIDPPTLKEGVESIIDPSLDMLLLVLHGQPAVTAVHFHAIQNAEAGFPATSPFAAHMTECKNYTRQLNRVRRILRGRLKAGRQLSKSTKTVPTTKWRKPSRTSFKKRTRPYRRSYRASRNGMQLRR